MSKTMSATDLRKDFFRALDDVERHEERVVVERNGRPVAMLVPFAGARPEIDEKRLREFCGQRGVKVLSLFGSFLRDDFGPASDMDVLVDMCGGRKYDFGEYLAMKTELEGIFGRPVDLVDRKTLLKHENEIRREEILRTAKIIVGGPLS